MSEATENEEANSGMDTLKAEKTNGRPPPQNDTKDHGKKKRKREKVDHYAQAYQNVRFEPIISELQPLTIPGVDHTILTTTPGSPLRQFKHSYRVQFLNQEKETNAESLSSPSSSQRQFAAMTQIVHQHANGLCVVTAGDAERLPSLDILERIDFLVKIADPCSAGARRKKQSKMLRKGNINYCQQNAENNATAAITAVDNDGIVRPDAILANLYCKSKSSHDTTTTSIPLFAGVWGSLLELNTELTLTQLVQDPLLNGYVAVILPTGPFPPKECVVSGEN